jgi:exonuclease SbcC
VRIRSLRFKNINSLVGEWEIDLIDHAFTDSGFFAITGPTGAGKSTVLDAVCLALYGRTPRQVKVSQARNDIMSTDTGECFAEVVFSTERGVFRSTWYQKRAHRKPGGTLQAPERSLSDATTGKVIETRVRDLEALVEEYTGMDFGRFTRTMFLAQGGFAAFLDAPVSERSAVLEEITGTQVYSELSMMVFERRKEEELRLMELQREHEDLHIMTPEEEASAKIRLEEVKDRVRTLEEQVQATGSGLAWLDTSDRLTREHTALLEDLGGAEHALRDFSPDKVRLDRAEQARGAEAAYQDIRRRREEREQLHERWVEERGQLPALEEEAAKVLMGEESAREALSVAEKDRDADAGPAREAHELDTLVTAKEAEISGYTHDLGAREAEIAEILRKTGDLDMERREVLGQAAVAEQYLSDNAGDSLLSEDLSGITHRCEEYREEAAKCSGAGKEHAEAAGKVAGEKEAVFQLEQETSRKEREQEALSRELSDREQALKDLLGGREVREVRETHAALAVREPVLAGLVKDARALADKRKKQEEAVASLDEKKKAALGAAQDLVTATGKAAWLTGHLERLRGAVREAEAALSAAGIRKSLEDGVPCPVCGSPDHPYAGGNVPELGPVREEARKVSRDLDMAREEVTRLTGLTEGLESDVRHLVERAESLAEEREQDCRAWKEAAEGPGIGVAGDDPVTAATAALKECRTGMKAATSLKDRMESLLEETDRTRSDLAGHGTGCQECQDDLRDARSRLALLEKEELHAAERLAVLVKGAETRLAAFRASVAKYGSFDDTPPDEVVSLLRDRRERFERFRETRDRALKEAEHLSGEISGKTARKEEKEASCRELREKALAAGRECTCLRERRMAVYGERDPVMEQERLAQAVEDLGRRLSVASEERIKQERALGGLKARLGMYERNDREMAAGMESSCREFNARLSETGFASEEELAAAILPADERRALEERKNGLYERLAAAKARAESKEQEIAQHRETGQVSVPKEVLLERLGEERELLKVAEREVYDLESGLSEDLGRREEARAIGERLRAQEETVQTWRKLDALIGSSDGKKFRSFAQGLTLGVLLDCANAHLQRLTDRYRLTRQKSSPFEIHVADSYRAGEVRPTKNLSGGETFIVSLALALGLSEMAGKNVRVDSLFLDEGFGTLDEDALDTALSALGKLRQEGKLIGVISHVQAVKDRVPVQIQVEKLPGGRSRLSGPGCRSRG